MNWCVKCAPRTPKRRQRRPHLNGRRGDLDVVQLAQRALPVDEVGGSQLVQSFQSHSGGVTRVIARLRLLTQFPLVNKYR